MKNKKYDRNWRYYEALEHDKMAQVLAYVAGQSGIQGVRYASKKGTGASFISVCTDKELMEKRQKVIDRQFRDALIGHGIGCGSVPE